MQANNSGVNTILIVILIMIAVGGGVWFYKTMVAGDKGTNTSSIEISVPNGTQSQN